MRILGTLLASLVKPLSIFLGFLFVKHQGAKEATLKGKANALKDSKEALKDRHDISNLDDDDLTNIVFFDDEHGGD